MPKIYIICSDPAITLHTEVDVEDINNHVCREVEQCLKKIVAAAGLDASHRTIGPDAVSIFTDGSGPRHFSAATSSPVFAAEDEIYALVRFPQSFIVQPLVDKTKKFKDETEAAQKKRDDEVKKEREQKKEAKDSLAASKEKEELLTKELETEKAASAAMEQSLRERIEGMEKRMEEMMAHIEGTNKAMRAEKERTDKAMRAGKERTDKAMRAEKERAEKVRAGDRRAAEDRLKSAEDRLRSEMERLRSETHVQSSEIAVLKETVVRIQFRAVVDDIQGVLAGIDALPMGEIPSMAWRTRLDQESSRAARVSYARSVLQRDTALAPLSSSQHALEIICAHSNRIRLDGNVAAHPSFNSLAEFDALRAAAMEGLLIDAERDAVCDIVSALSRRRLAVP
ncbi:hypothetical protein NLJ89_g1730 [Agrocybe chaxingu]|uniref:Uncharacterized protein n=1 Tax=Agrocybe chaxingu TaxID=84603 RepID=A0A9W8TCW0_9AGAR|nr:hypothetical protein NLJ89_g1730 [Agrocybe chaxingu]